MVQVALAGPGLCLIQDYHNAAFIKKLRQISAARILMRVRIWHVPPGAPDTDGSLHLCMENKLCLLTNQCTQRHAPCYLKELLTPQTTSRQLRCTHSHLRPPLTKLHKTGDQASAAAAPRLWNVLLETSRAQQTKVKRKTFFSDSWFNTTWAAW